MGTGDDSDDYDADDDDDDNQGGMSINCHDDDGDKANNGINIQARPLGVTAWVLDPSRDLFGLQALYLPTTCCLRSFSNCHMNKKS